MAAVELRVWLLLVIGLSMQRVTAIDNLSAMHDFRGETCDTSDFTYIVYYGICTVNVNENFEDSRLDWCTRRFIEFSIPRHCHGPTEDCRITASFGSDVCMYGGWFMAHETIGRPMEILLVEDSLTFARLAINALRKGQVQHRLTWLTDGAEAWQFLQQAGTYINAPRPDLLLLDLKLPGLDGMELLARIRADDKLAHLPVVVMTGDSDASCELPIEAFLPKPLDFEKFISIVKQLSHLWQADMIVPVHSEPAPIDDLMDFGDR